VLSKVRTEETESMLKTNKTETLTICIW